MEHDTSSMENDLGWAACDMRATRRYLLKMALLVGAASPLSEIATVEFFVVSAKPHPLRGGRNAGGSLHKGFCRPD